MRWTFLGEQQEAGIEEARLRRDVLQAGSPIPPSVAAAFVSQGIKPQNVYGMTENSSHQYTTSGRRCRDHRQYMRTGGDPTK